MKRVMAVAVAIVATMAMMTVIGAAAASRRVRDAARCLG